MSNLDTPSLLRYCVCVFSPTNTILPGHNHHRTLPLHQWPPPNHNLIFSKSSITITTTKERKQVKENSTRGDATTTLSLTAAIVITATILLDLTSIHHEQLFHLTPTTTFIVSLTARRLSLSRRSLCCYVSVALDLCFLGLGLQRK